MTDIDKLRWRALIDSPDGRAALLSILTQCRIEEKSFALDDRTTSFNEGRRYVGIELRHQIETADPHGWLKLVKQEIDDAELKRNAKLSDTGNPDARGAPSRIAGAYSASAIAGD